MHGEDAVFGMNFQVDAASLRSGDFGANATPRFDESERHFDFTSARIPSRGPRRRVHPVEEVLHVAAGDRVVRDRVEERRLEGLVISHRDGVWGNHASGAFWGRVRVTAIRSILRDRNSTGSGSPDQPGLGRSEGR